MLGFKRALAFAIDVCLLAAYVSALVFVSYTSGLGTFIEQSSSPPLFGQIVGFTSLTLPYFLYNYFLEKGTKGATLGKRAFKIKVDSPSKKAILLRNMYKLLPWELAHFAVHWIFHLGLEQFDLRNGFWLLAILAQVVLFTSIVMVIWSKGQIALHDKLAGTSLSLGE